MLLGIHLGSFVYLNGLGILTGENGGYFLERDPDTVVAPDVGFISQARLALWPGREGFFPGPPDLAIGIISPADEAGDIRRKKSLYDRIGVPLVWWIDPKHRAASVHAPGRPVQHLAGSDTLDGESVVPGFSVPLSTLFDF